MKRRALTPDDDRHGTYAGAVAHWHAGIPMCQPCSDAQYAANKRNKHNRDHGKPGLIPLGTTAWQKLDACGITQMWHASGIDRNMLYRIHANGPQRMVHRTTRDTILNATIPFTAIGIQRRLQALAAIGYPTEHIAPLIGSAPSALNVLRRRPNPQFVRHNTGLRIVDVYNNLHMTPISTPNSSTNARTHAKQNGWHAPLAWDDIDFDPTPPKGMFDGIDHAAIQRTLDGDRSIKLTVAERRHIIRTLHARGYTDKQIQDTAGIHQNTVGITRHRLGLPLNPALIDWAEYGSKTRPKKSRSARASTQFRGEAPSKIGDSKNGPTKTLERLDGPTHSLATAERRMA